MALKGDMEGIEELNEVDDGSNNFVTKLLKLYNLFLTIILQKYIHMLNTISVNINFTWNHCNTGKTFLKINDYKK